MLSSLVPSFPSSCAPLIPHTAVRLSSLGDCGIHAGCVCVFNRNVLSTYCVPRTVQLLSSHKLKNPCPSAKSILVLRSVLQEGQTEAWESHGCRRGTNGWRFCGTAGLKTHPHRTTGLSTAGKERNASPGRRNHT